MIFFMGSPFAFNGVLLNASRSPSPSESVVRTGTYSKPRAVCRRALTLRGRWGGYGKRDDVAVPVIR